jgi:hypothetical protein
LYVPLSSRGHDAQILGKKRNFFCRVLDETGRRYMYILLPAFPEEAVERHRETPV